MKYSFLYKSSYTIELYSEQNNYYIDKNIIKILFEYNNSLPENSTIVINNKDYINVEDMFSFLFKIKNETSIDFLLWLKDIINQINLNNISSELKQKEKELNDTIIKLHDTQILVTKLEEIKNVPCIYIFNTNKDIEPPELKIGYTINVSSRIKSYKQTNKNSYLVKTFPLMCDNIRTFENFIHLTLQSYRYKDEVYKMSIDTAENIIFSIITLFNIIKDNSDLKDKKYSHLVKSLNLINNNVFIEDDKNEIYKEAIIENTENKIIIEKIPKTIPLVNYVDDFNKFIESECILQNDLQSSSVDIIGRYRIWSKIIEKKRYHSLLEYLGYRFLKCRIDTQDKNHIIYGYKGIGLKKINIPIPVYQSEIETFIYNFCSFSPAMKILTSTILNEYNEWRKNVGKPIDKIYDIEFKQYLKNNNNILHSNVWTDLGNGDGYYGITLKKYVKINRTSSTAKQVFKKTLNHEIICTWPSICKAAESEDLPTCKLSRAIKNKITFNNEYYYCLTN